MKKIKWVVISFLLAFTMIAPITAETSNDPDGDGIPGIEGIDYDIEIIADEDFKAPEKYVSVSPKLASGYSIKNVRHSGGGSGPFALAQTSPPGGVMSWENTYSVNLTVQTMAGFSIADVSASVGYSLSRTYTKKLAYSIKVPSTHNGKKVKTLKVYPRLEHDTYTYDFYYKTKKIGSGYAEKATNLNWVHLYTYK